MMGSNQYSYTNGLNLNLHPNILSPHYNLNQLHSRFSPSTRHTSHFSTTSHTGLGLIKLNTFNINFKVVPIINSVSEFKSVVGGFKDRLARKFPWAVDGNGNGNRDEIVREARLNTPKTSLLWGGSVPETPVSDHLPNSIPKGKISGRKKAQGMGPIPTFKVSPPESPPKAQEDLVQGLEQAATQRDAGHPPTMSGAGISDGVAAYKAGESDLGMGNPLERGPSIGSPSLRGGGNVGSNMGRKGPGNTGTSGTTLRHLWWNIKSKFGRREVDDEESLVGDIIHDHSAISAPSALPSRSPISAPDQSQQPSESKGKGKAPMRENQSSIEVSIHPALRTVPAPERNPPQASRVKLGRKNSTRSTSKGGGVPHKRLVKKSHQKPIGSASLGVGKESRPVEQGLKHTNSQSASQSGQTLQKQRGPVEVTDPEKGSSQRKLSTRSNEQRKQSTTTFTGAAGPSKHSGLRKRLSSGAHSGHQQESAPSGNKKRTIPTPSSPIPIESTDLRHNHSRNYGESWGRRSLSGYVPRPGYRSGATQQSQLSGSIAIGIEGIEIPPFREVVDGVNGNGGSVGLGIGIADFDAEKRRTTGGATRALDSREIGGVYSGTISQTPGTKPETGRTKLRNYEASGHTSDNNQSGRRGRGTLRQGTGGFSSKENQIEQASENSSGQLPHRTRPSVSRRPISSPTSRYSIITVEAYSALNDQEREDYLLLERFINGDIEFPRPTTTGGASSIVLAQRSTSNLKSSSMANSRERSRDERGDIRMGPAIQVGEQIEEQDSLGELEAFEVGYDAEAVLFVRRSPRTIGIMRSGSMEEREGNAAGKRHSERRELREVEPRRAASGGRVTRFTEAVV